MSHMLASTAGGGDGGGGDDDYTGPYIPLPTVKPTPEPTTHHKKPKHGKPTSAPTPAPYGKNDGGMAGKHDGGNSDPASP